MIRFLSLIGLIACTRSEPVQETPSPRDAAPVIDSGKPDCGLVSEIEFELTWSPGSMNPWPHYRKAIELWKATPPTCRRGRWHLAAARLLELRATRTLEVDSIRLETSEAALIAALEQPDDLQVLTRAAEVSSYGRRVALPADACPRARVAAAAEKQNGDRYSDDAHFVCARKAIENLDPVAAEKELAAIVDGGSADLELARAQTAALRRDHLAAKRHAAKAIEIASRGHSLEPAADTDAIVRLARDIR